MWKAREARLRQYLGRPAHVKIGNTAVSWFNEHYRQEEWFNGSGWQKWKKPKRFDAKGTTSQKYGTLLSKRQHLFRSTHYIADATRAVIINRVPYAEAHNQGAEFEQSIPITPKMRRWAWYMYYKNSGGKLRKGQKRTGNPLSDKYKALALTKKKVINRHVSIPKRPFIYANAELAKVLRERLKEDVRKILIG